MSTRQLLKTLRKLSKVSGGSCNIIITASVLVLELNIQIGMHFCLQEASNRINLSSDSASRQRESYRRNYDILMEVR